MLPPFTAFHPTLNGWHIFTSPAIWIAISTSRDDVPCFAVISHMACTTQDGKIVNIVITLIVWFHSFYVMYA